MNATLSGLLAIGMWSIFGVLFLFVRELPPFEILTAVFFTGYLFYTFVQLYRREDIRHYWRQPLSYYAFWLGGAGFYTALIYIAFSIGPVFEANILNYLWPLLLVVFSVLIYREPLPFHRIAGLLLGFSGAFLVIMPSGDDGLFENVGAGHVLALMAGAVWALYSTLTRNRDYPQGFQAPAFLVFAAFCLVFHLVFEDTVMPGAQEWIFLIVMGILRISYAFWDYGMKKGNVILLASVSYFLPFLSSLLLIVFGEKPGHPLIALGAALICAGCLVVNYRQLGNLFHKSKI
jgi:drug/metabolite transporter (DMT)-like permease